MVRVTHIRLSPDGTRHEHITEVRWTNPTTGATGDSTRQQMVDFLTGGANRAVVVAGGTEVEIGVVNAHPPYIRTHADGVWTDNLLALPHF